jgi:hypothetical protein
MDPLRTLIRDYRKLAFVLLALALCLKALVPAGFMVERRAMVLTVSICADGLGVPSTRQMVIPMKSDPSAHKGDQSKPDGSCSFTALGFGALAAVDPALLTAALLFIIALGFTRVAERRRIVPHRLLPPAHGPPSFG